MKLLALRCPECANPLAPGIDHIVIACERCAAAVRIGDEGPAIASASYAAPQPDAPVTRWLPFWVFRGSVGIDRRDTQGGDSRLAEALRFWGTVREMYVPAWELSLHTAEKVGGALIQRQPAFSLTPRPPGARITPVTLAPGDARRMLEFIVLAIEAGRSDWLKSIDFQLGVGEPALWALPADGERFVALEA